jgi:hypothetical protein
VKSRVLVPLTVASLLACSSDMIIPDQSTSAIIYGQVTDPAAFHGSCAADHWFALDNAVTTEGNGRYRVRPISFGGDFTGCVLLEFSHPGEAAIDTVRVENVPFRTTTTDSLSVDVVLRS